jgi:hypothetical protein
MAWRRRLNRNHTWRANARESKGVFDSAPLIFVDQTQPRGSWVVVGRARLPLRNAPIFSVMEVMHHRDGINSASSLPEEVKMVDSKPTVPLDLSLFDDLDSTPRRSLTVPPAAQPAMAADPRLAPEPEPERLVDIANLGREDLAAADAAAAKIDFRNTSTLLSHGEGVLGGIAQASRQPGRRPGLIIPSIQCVSRSDPRPCQTAGKYPR